MIRTTVEKMSRTAYDMKVEALAEKAEKDMQSLTNQELGFLVSAGGRLCKEHPEVAVPNGTEHQVKAEWIAEGHITDTASAVDIPNKADTEQYKLHRMKWKLRLEAEAEDKTEHDALRQKCRDAGRKLFTPEERAEQAAIRQRFTQRLRDIQAMTADALTAADQAN